MSALGSKADIAREVANVRFSPKADIGGSGLVLCKLTTGPHSADHKSLL